MIEVSHITKEFLIQNRSTGRFATLRDLFHRTYRKKVAVDDVSFTIGDGEIVAYIGPNGSGKSTTIKMLSGILTPTSGTVTVDGLVPYENRKQNAKRIGVVFGQRTQLWWDIPVRQSLELMRYIYKVPEDVFKRNMDAFSELLDLSEFIDTPVRQLSLGQRMRADLCASLLHNPPVLYLDEPTIGLDIVVKQKMRAFIQEINQQRGTTILLTTHDISDIEHLCKRVIVIEKGTIKYTGTLEELKRRYGRRETITVQTAAPFAADAELLATGVESIRRKDGELVISYDRERQNAMAILNVVAKTVQVLDFQLVGTEIEDVIASIYQAK